MIENGDKVLCLWMLRLFMFVETIVVVVSIIQYGISGRFIIVH